MVVDASAVLELILGTTDSVAVAARLLRSDEHWHAPHLLDVEVTHALRRYVLLGEVTAKQASAAVADFLDLPIERHGHLALIPRAWELRATLLAYDAMYVALAEGLAAPLVTRDGRLARAHGHRARIELV